MSELSPPPVAKREVGLPRLEPIAFFESWLAEAIRAKAAEPSAMALATVDENQRPQVRMVLLKSVDERGFVFYTNLESPKARQLRARPYASLCFHWPELERQVRVDGYAEPVSAEEADAYFASRARLSQLGAWASRQSQPMEGYWELEKAVAKMALKYPLGLVPRPAFWSGYRVRPDRLEFWRQKPFRHHERFVYESEGAGGTWAKQWLFP